MCFSLSRGKYVCFLDNTPSCGGRLQAAPKFRPGIFYNFIYRLPGKHPGNTIVPPRRTQGLAVILALMVGTEKTLIRE